MHEGGFTGGHPCVPFCAHLSRATCKAVFTVDYRMCPEHSVPVAVCDVVDAYLWLVEDQHVPPDKIALWGASAGATYVVLAMQEIARRGLPLPACGVPVSSWSPEISQSTQPPMVQMYLGNTDRYGNSTGCNVDVLDEKYNMLAGKFEGLTPLYVMVGGEENYGRDVTCSLRLFDKAKDAGVQVVLDIVQNMQHTPDALIPVVPESVEAVARANKFIDDCMSKK